ncbi:MULTISPECIES: ferredoxin [unclassified Salinibacterium]|uniref:ferredoxin n=1 Tax=unclassified Salinibacterium TaxID=2632331 RepID=UPI0018CEE625|nr:MULTISPECIES: ferredoxin [unclassified Salinibacterium]MBH0024825.1 ferredoxin [Salinibacterium sp. SWN248]MBH0054828.1 ferredoxin [Salinibacterium sp. SWN139]MBH0084027.1 ferredoxin [Salinibacterium sp. SWN167]
MSDVHTEAARMRIVVDRGRCTGIGICESLAPEHFEVSDDGSLLLLSETVTDADLEDVETAVRSCPAKALKLEVI